MRYEKFACIFLIEWIVLALTQLFAFAMMSRISASRRCRELSKSLAPLHRTAVASSTINLMLFVRDCR